MRTTLQLDDRLVVELKRRAAERKTTMTALIEEAVRAAFRRDEVDVTEVPELPTFAGGGGLQPGVDLHDQSALADLMDER